MSDPVIIQRQQQLPTKTVPIIKGEIITDHCLDDRVHEPQELQGRTPQMLLFEYVQHNKRAHHTVVLPHKFKQRFVLL